MSGRLFLSYAHEDRALVWLLARELERRGVNHYSYVAHAEPAERPMQRVRAEMKQATEFLLILSPQSKRAPFLSYEYGLADAYGLPKTVGLHYLTLSQARHDRKWFEFVKENTFELVNLVHLVGYLDALQRRLNE